MPKIDHVIVLMLENRSCDHMFGFLKHPNPAFKNFNTIDWCNPWDGHDPVAPTDDATGQFMESPDHSHAGVMYQLTGKPATKPSFPPGTVIDNSGFVNDFEVLADSPSKGHGPGHGDKIMRCFKESEIPVLSTLAREFAVCSNWFCSVPGETWPNRNYAIAATSHNEVDIHIKFYFDETIFEQLQSAKRSWSIYHDGIAQSRAFLKLSNPFNRYGFRKMRAFFEDVQRGTLPNYSFIEPRHGFIAGDLLGSNSQHPGDNKESGRDFYAGENLVRKIYTELRHNRQLFERTLLVITYDEHGGFPDHVPPPCAPPPKAGEKNDEWGFEFNLLGPRVPSILISPWIPKNVVDDNTYDHSSIVATVRKLFAPGLPALTDRDDAANTFEDHVVDSTLPVSRYESEEQPLPVFAPKAAAIALETAAAPGPVDPAELNEMQQSLLQLQVLLNEEMMKQEVEQAGISEETRKLFSTIEYDDKELKVPKSGFLEQYLDATESLERDTQPRHVEVRDDEAARVDIPDQASVRVTVEALHSVDDARQDLRLVDNEGAALITSNTGSVELYARPDRHVICRDLPTDYVANVVEAFQREGATAAATLIETYRPEVER